jgi:hypothetical protein
MDLIFMEAASKGVTKEELKKCLSLQKQIEESSFKIKQQMDFISRIALQTKTSYVNSSLKAKK